MRRIYDTKVVAPTHPGEGGGKEHKSRQAYMRGIKESYNFSPRKEQHSSVHCVDSRHAEVISALTCSLIRFSYAETVGELKTRAGIQLAIQTRFFRFRILPILDVTFPPLSGCAKKGLILSLKRFKSSGGFYLFIFFRRGRKTSIKTDVLHLTFVLIHYNYNISRIKK